LMFSALVLVAGGCIGGLVLTFSALVLKAGRTVCGSVLPFLTLVLSIMMFSRCRFNEALHGQECVGGGEVKCSRAELSQYKKAIDAVQG
jgi:hypothetical protein